MKFAVEVDTRKKASVGDADSASVANFARSEVLNTTNAEHLDSQHVCDELLCHLQFARA
jgi:hypothetical protein